MKMFVPDGYTAVHGRSQEKARELLARAEAAGLDTGSVLTSTSGYLVPSAILEAEFDPTPTDEKSEDGSGENPKTEKLEEANTEAFNPSDHNVDVVLAHLADADEAERNRVLAAEQADKKRSTILAATTEGAK